MTNKPEYTTITGGYFTPSENAEYDIGPTVEKCIQPFCVDWVDSTYQVIDDQGTLQESGTVLLVCNNIIYLKALTDDQLKELGRVVQESVDYELSKRNK